MSRINRYEDLLVWQKAHEFVLCIYQTTSKFPSHEQFGLTSQMRRAVVSIPSNISEGSKRQHTKELIQFLFISKGSLGEVEYYLKLAKDLNYVSLDDYNNLYFKCDEIGRMLAGLIKSLKGGGKSVE